MAIDLDDEILQDFLVEAGEILELLGEQLVELEQTPDDFDLLNAIFRGFHTVKGGAGFLSINALVDVCHNAEDVFNILRQGDRQATPELMDVILQVLDVVNEMFDLVRSGTEPDAADASLLAALRSFASGGEVSGEAPTTEPDAEQESMVEAEEAQDIAEDPQPSVTTDEELASASKIVEQEFESMLEAVGDAGEASPAGNDSDEITEEEFEDLLDALHGQGGSPTPSEAQISDDEITEEEFDKLLDDLHGEGKFSGTNKQAETVDTTPEQVPDMPVEENEISGSGEADLINDDEFEKVLDDLHGAGKFNASNLDVAANKEEAPANVPDSTPKEEKQTSPAPAPEAPKKTPAKAEPKAPPGKPEKVKASAKQAGKSSPPQAESTVRVDTFVLDEIMNMVGELVLVRNRFQTLKANDEGGEQFAKAVSNLDVVTADLQLAVMKTRMQPIKKVFGRFPRVVRDLARNLNKEIRLDLVGEETDLDKNLVEALADPLVHLVRNAVDHGVEMPEDRVAAGKPREGVVVLTASQEGDHILLSIKDDGKGMNADMLRAKVVEKGLMDEESAARLDDKECYNLIFMPGFSTKTEISDVSGRGVGMDVVKTRITQMNGIVEVDSKEGVGSTIIIKVPLTLAIMPTLMVKLAGQAFALPLASVLEILDLDLNKTNVVDGQLVVMVRERALPLFFLAEWLVQDPSYVVDKTELNHVVVVNSGGRQIGFVVDQLIGQEEVVIKPLGAKLHGLDGLAGATITGDGKIALILDVPGLMKRYAS